MAHIQYFEPQPTPAEIPERLRDPFDNDPHPLAIAASDKLKAKLQKTLPKCQDGKMFGVLVVSDKSGQIGFLSGFSGMLNQQWQVPGFVPPVFDIEQQQLFWVEGETTLNELTATINGLSHCSDYLSAIAHHSNLEQQQNIALTRLKTQHQGNKQHRKKIRSALLNHVDASQRMSELASLSQQDKREYLQLKLQSKTLLLEAAAQIDRRYRDNISQLIAQRKALSQSFNEQLFDTYQLKNSLGDIAATRSLFDGNKAPSGAGDCAAPKLLQSAVHQHLKPLALAEFWWGRPPKTGVRHHGNFYPPCRGKCHPILPFMLKGLDIETSEGSLKRESLRPVIVYEDADIVVVNKPPDLLSIPGKQESHSVLSWLRTKYPNATGALLVHRLDMATSGLLLAAKTSQAHKHLQRQFVNRSVEKRYLAVLSKVLVQEEATIDLPMRVDLDDRPRQIVCYENGKMATTRMQVISRDHQSTRVYFYPVTGRTHQLRVHAAHCQGLSAPIVGDDLYGTRAERLLLHAQMLRFIHPTTSETMQVFAPEPF